MSFQLPVDATEESRSAVLTYLVQRGLAGPSDALRLERPGPSNMNCVWRALLPRGNLILKQARSWVEKFPSIAAPVDRAEAEARFYRLTGQNIDLAARLPRLIDHDANTHLLVLGDLAPAEPLEAAYSGRSLLDSKVIEDLARWVTRLHKVEIPSIDAEKFRNRGMRALNHAHIFDLPLREAGVFDELLERITPGLADLARKLRSDDAYVSKVGSLGRRYLDADRPSLIHGDLFLGSLLLKNRSEIMVIDPEFSFGGDPEFDLGVFYAHLLLSNQSPMLASEWLERTVILGEASVALVKQYAGVEIMRRLIGVAQLPLTVPLDVKRELLEHSRKLVCAGDSG